MTSIKVRKMDMISGVTEFQVYCLADLNYQYNNFFNDTVPDITINSNINIFMSDEINQYRIIKNNKLVPMS
jgi:hypothetical protein